MNRRTAIQTTALAAGATLLSGVSVAQKNNLATMKPPTKVRHSASRWCYGSIPLEEFVIEAKKLGVTSVELTGPDEWPILKKHGLTCAMGNGKFPEGTGLTSFWGDEKNHDALVAFYEEIIPKAKAAGIPSIICFSGNRNGRSDYEGLRICAKGIKRVIKLFEENDIIMSMELFNSKINHPDYFADSTIWGVTLCDMVGSDHFKLLYDIYHMQIMEGDIIRNIQDYHTYFNHYHTGGVPGRREINDTQELYYPAIIKAIMATGYTGFIGQEFIPTPEDNAGKLESLKEAVGICSV
ncbi:MAG: hydroxypyruvate isomerase family protein [Saprospiraceae bacterium]